MAKSNDSTNTTASATPQILLNRPCALEDNYGVFHAETIHVAAPKAAALMRDMNQIMDVVRGMAVIQHIAAGNSVLRNQYAPGEDGEPPLSNYAIGSLMAMSGAMCEMMCDMIEKRADKYNKEVAA